MNKNAILVVGKFFCPFTVRRRNYLTKIRTPSGISHFRSFLPNFSISIQNIERTLVIIKRSSSSRVMLVVKLLRFLTVDFERQTSIWRDSPMKRGKAVSVHCTSQLLISTRTSKPCLLRVIWITIFCVMLTKWRYPVSHSHSMLFMVWYGCEICVTIVCKRLALYSMNT